MEIALIPEWFRTEILQEALDSKNVLVERSDNIESVKFALLFEFDGDVKCIRHVLYNCVAARPSVTGATKEDSITPQTETLNLTATAIYVSALSTEVVKGETVAATGSTVYDGWFSAVTQPTAPVVTT